MANLAVSKIDPERAAAAVTAVIRDELPGATVEISVQGSATAPSFWSAVGHELATSARDTEPILFAITANVRAARTLQVRCRYVQIGLMAVVASVAYLARFDRRVVGPVAYTRSSKPPFAGEPVLCEALERDGALTKTLRRFPWPEVTVVTTTFHSPARLELVPDEAGSLLFVQSAPRATWNSYVLEIGKFFALCDRVDTVLSGVPGAWVGGDDERRRLASAVAAAVSREMQLRTLRLSPPPPSPPWRPALELPTDADLASARRDVEAAQAALAALGDRSPRDGAAT